MPEDKFLQADGLRLHYRDYGGANLPALLFLHGLTGNVYCFDHVAPEFVGTHHVLALDFRGHGESDRHSDGDYAFQRHVSDTLALLAALEITKVSLVGNSMGGAVAMVIAAIKPDLVERLVLNDIGPEISATPAKDGPKPPNHIEMEFRNLSEALECYMLSYPPVRNLAESIATDLVRNSTRVAENGLLRWKADPRVQAIAPSSGTSTSSPGMWPLFDAVKAPILVIRGGESDALLPSAVARMVSRRPGIRAVEVPGVGHTPWLSEPEALASLRDFLRDEG
jgi:pimeloyl-ACP methyl ester carboxylesterase